MNFGFGVHSIDSTRGGSTSGSGCPVELIGGGCISVSVDSVNSIDDACISVSAEVNWFDSWRLHFGCGGFSRLDKWWLNLDSWVKVIVYNNRHSLIFSIM